MWNKDHAHLLLDFETAILSCNQEQLLAVAAHGQNHLAAYVELLLERFRNLRCCSRDAYAVVWSGPGKAQASLGLNNSDIRDMATMTDWLTRPRRSSISVPCSKLPTPNPDYVFGLGHIDKALAAQLDLDYTEFESFNSSHLAHLQGFISRNCDL